MKKIFIMAGVLLAITISIAYAKKDLPTAITTPIPVDQIVGYSTYSPVVKDLIAKSLKLSKMHLTYEYGSADPKNNGMDCSGTMYYLLNESNLKNVPRDAESLFNWVKKGGKLYQPTSNDFNSSGFSKLKPGDLLFWSGTYATHHSISHVMLYLGKNKEGQPLMFGASDGRTYQGKRMWGVSVFDFQLPRGSGRQKFEGYGCIPGLTCK
jgi:hypothetical protein